MEDEKLTTTLLMPGVLIMLGGKVVIRSVDGGTFTVSSPGKPDKTWHDLYTAECDAWLRAHALVKMGFA